MVRSAAVPRIHSWFAVALLALLPSPSHAQAAPAGKPASAGPETWYTERLMAGGATPTIEHLWSKGPWLRSELVVGGQPIVQLVKGNRYVIVNRLQRKGIAIQRSPLAIAHDAAGKRPFADDRDRIVAAGGERVGSHELAGQDCEVYRITDGDGRRETCVTASGLPVRTEMWHRASGASSSASYLSWASQVPLTDEFFEPDPGVDDRGVRLRPVPGSRDEGAGRTRAADALLSAPREMTVEASRLPQDYLPARHVLRDLRLWAEAGAEPPCAGIPVAPALFGATGACAAGALGVLVDAVAGGAALRAAPESWIATSDMRLSWLAPVRGGELVARARPLRAGRTNIVLEVEVHAADALVAHGAVAFSRLEAQGEYQRRPRAEKLGRAVFGTGGSGFERPWAEAMGACVRDAAAGAVELPLGPYVGNSLGGLQGGVAVALLDFAAEAAGGAVLGRPVATRDLAVHFLAIGRAGPLVTRAALLRRGRDEALLRIESRDAGADDRLCTVATATVGGFG